MNSPGRLMLKPLEARINRNTQWFGHMDPFVRFEFDNQRFQSQVSKGGGINPVWNDAITFNKFNGHLLYIALLDHQTMKDHDLIGSTQIDISDIFIKTQPTTKIIDLFHDGFVAAKIQIYFFFEPTVNQLSFGGGGSLMMSKKHKQNMNNQFNQFNQSGNNNSQGYNNYQQQPYQNYQNQYQNSYQNQQNNFSSHQFNNGNSMQNQQYPQPYQQQQQQNNNVLINNSKQSTNFQQVIANQFGMRFSQDANNKPIQPPQPPQDLSNKLPQILQPAKPQNQLYPSLSTKYEPIKVQQAPSYQKQKPVQKQKQEQKPLLLNKSTKSITQQQKKDFTAEQMDDLLK